MKKKSNLKTRVNETTHLQALLVNPLHELTCIQLRVELQKHKLSISGNKAALVERLGKFLESEQLLMASAHHGRYGQVTQRRQVDVHSNGDSISSMSENLQGQLREREERKKLVLWRHPITTLVYFCKELFINLYSYGESLLRNRLFLVAFFIIQVAAIVAYKTPGPHQKLVMWLEGELLWWLYWIGLGILSSVGLGTGLHTFLLYLGPHIASVTMAAYECGSLNFPQPPYPNEILCPEDSNQMVSLWSIMSKVRVEAFMWGAGTALGELPPYFMARAARLSGVSDEDDEELKEFEELQRKKDNPQDITFLDRAKLSIEKLVERVGFIGILLCASIPNPLFDLAGITCGHFLIPFWTFFGATLIGKAVIKMHLQKICVIVAFSETLLNKVASLLIHVPLLGTRLEAPFREFLNSQKAKLHKRVGIHASQDGGSLLAAIFEKLVIIMILYFVVSIINSLAQSYHKRIHKMKKKSTKD